MKSFALVLLLGLSPSISFSQSYPLMRVLQKDFPQNTAVIFFPACGIGSYLLPSYSWFSSAPASATNVSSSVFAPTSTVQNMSQCKGPKKIVENKPEIFNFAKNNLDQLSLDISRGDGETLNALATLLEIPQLERNLWKTSLKNDFSLIFPAPNVDVAYVLDQIASSSNRADIHTPYARNFYWNELTW